MIIDIGVAKDLSKRYKAKRVLETNRRAILPGLIDTHGHAGSLLKTIGIHLEGRGWRRMYDHICFRGTTEDSWYADGLLSTLERVRFGTTLGVSILGSAPRSDVPIYGRRFIDGISEVGCRGIVGIGPSRPPWPKKFSHWRNGKRIDQWVTLDDCLKTTEELISDAHNSSDGRIQVWVSASRFSVPSPYDPMFEESQLEYALDQAKRMREVANKYNTGIHTHAYGGVISYLEEHLPTVLGPDVLLAHCTGISEEELGILERTNTKVSHCPTSKRMFSYPVSVPILEMIERGIVVSLGADASAPDRTFDLFRNMRAAILLQRKRVLDPWALPPGKVLEMVTIDAAKAVGMEDRIGSLEVGKEADIILINLESPHLKPTFMIPYRLIHQACGHDVETVLVRGKIIMEDNSIKSIDEDGVMTFAQEEAEKMVECSGIAPLMQIPNQFWGHSRY